MMIETMLLAAVLPFPREFSPATGSVAWTEPKVSVGAKLPAEGYEIRVGADGIAIAAADARGAQYARETLSQMKGADGRVPCGTVRDWPQYPYRIVQIDEGRHFFGKRFILKTLELMARYKLNTLHWHLCEDQGWRIQIDRYPNLTKEGATRARSTVRGRYTGAYDNRPYGPFFYTKAEIREVLKRAAELHIDVIPEVEMPGHTRSILAAYPELGCPNAPLDERTCWTDFGICEDVICAGNDKVLKFYCDVIDEICELFPSKVIHLGGDECTAKNWAKCPKCRARMAKEGLKDPHELQGWLTGKIMAYLKSKGRTYMGYSACLLTGVKADPADVIAMSGCGEPGALFAAQGWKVVMGPTEYCYWDFNQGLADDPCTYGTWWAGSNPISQVYSFSPAAAVPPDKQKNVLGGVAFNWSEYTYSAKELEWKIWPRAIAFSQALWNPQSGYSFQEQFVPAVGPHIERLRREGVNAAGLPPTCRRATTGGASAANQAL